MVAFATIATTNFEPCVRVRESLGFGLLLGSDYRSRVVIKVKPGLHFERKSTSHTQTIVRVFPATNADLRRRDRADAEYKHSYNTPSFTRGCWIAIG